MDITIILSSSLLVGLIAGFVAIRTGERKILIENVTQERAKWREKIRELSLEAHQAACSENTDRLNELVLEFSLRLNPTDKEDRNIIRVICELSTLEDKSGPLIELRERVSLLLKHDWERAKYEAISWFHKFMPKRINYTDFKESNKVTTTINNTITKRKFDLKSFVSSMLASGAIFFIVSVLKDPFVDIIIKYDKEFYTLSAFDHLLFLLLSLFAGLLWTPLYFWFKGSEIIFLEKWFKRKG